MHSPAEEYREVVNYIKNDPISSGLALENFVPENYWKEYGGDVLLLGAGGSSLAMSLYLTSKNHKDNVPGRQAITELVQEGWLYRVKSKGTFVAQPKISPDSDMAKNFRLKEGDRVIYLYRKRLADGEPIVTLETYLPYSICSFVLEHNLEEERLYSILNQSKETAVFRVNRIVEAIEADKNDEKYLNIEHGKPIQHFSSIGYNIYDRPIEYSLARYRGDRNRFEITVFPYTIDDTQLSNPA